MEREEKGSYSVGLFDHLPRSHHPIRVLVLSFARTIGDERPRSGG